MTSQPFGRGLLTWCDRHLAPDFVDAVVHPLVADAQREELAARSHSRSVHWLVVLRVVMARQAPAAWTRWIGLGTVGLLGAVLSLSVTWRRHPIAAHSDR